MSLLNRRDVLHTLLSERGRMIVVAGLGSSAYDLAACGNEPLDFPLWGAMGGASMVGLGLALAQPEYTVLVVTGDGEMLMGLGSLATIAAQHPVFEGDTIYSQSEVLERRESKSRPHAGIVTVKTTGYNQRGQVVITFKRTVMVYKRGHAPQIARLQPERP